MNEKWKIHMLPAHKDGSISMLESNIEKSLELDKKCDQYCRRTDCLEP